MSGSDRGSIQKKRGTLSERSSGSQAGERFVLINNKPNKIIDASDHNSDVRSQGSPDLQQMAKGEQSPIKLNFAATTVAPGDATPKTGGGSNATNTNGNRQNSIIANMMKHKFCNLDIQTNIEKKNEIITNLLHNQVDALIQNSNIICKYHEE